MAMALHLRTTDLYDLPALRISATQFCRYLLDCEQYGSVDSQTANLLDDAYLDLVRNDPKATQELHELLNSKRIC